MARKGRFTGKSRRVLVICHIDWDNYDGVEMDGVYGTDEGAARAYLDIYKKMVEEYDIEEATDNKQEQVVLDAVTEAKQAMDNGVFIEVIRVLDEAGTELYEVCNVSYYLFTETVEG